MECPICEGAGYDVNEPAYGIKQKICPHCNGTGEIQEGDWWLCEQVDDYDNEKRECPCIYSNELSWCWCKGVKIDMGVFKKFTPIRKLKEVK